MDSDNQEPGCSASSNWDDIVGSARKPPKKEEKSRGFNCDNLQANENAKNCSLCLMEATHDPVQREIHWNKHAGFMDSPDKLPCPTCYSFFSRGDIKQHIKETHPDTDATIYDDESFEINCYTSKTTWVKPLVGEESKRKDISIHRKSKFTQSKHLNEKRIDTFKTYLRSKLADSPDDLSIPFLYKIHRATKEWPVHWCCPYCEDEEYAVLMKRFRNDISMRVYALRHLESHCDEREGLARLVEKEWKYMQKELHEDIRQHFDSDYDLRQKYRSVSYYCRGYNDPMASLACEMVRRGGDQSILPQRTVLCLICYNPVYQLTARHFHRYHPELQIHCEETEFRQVPEIAKCLFSKETFIPTFLSYSKVFKIKEADDSDSSAFWKWRCPIACADNGHTDDVLEFPSIHLLRLYALKHIQLFHPSMFHQEFLDREWAMVHNDLKLPVDFRTYCAKDEDHFHLANPNEFCIPFSKKMFGGNSIAIEKFKICGFCFWCGHEDHFIDHILQHNYVNAGDLLFSNSLAYGLGDDDRKKSDYVVEEIGEPVRRILTKAGKKMVKKLFSANNDQKKVVPAVEDNADGEVGDEDLIAEPVAEVEPLEAPSPPPVDYTDSPMDVPKGSSAESLLGTDNEETQDCPPTQQDDEEEIGDGALMERTFESITSGEIVVPENDDLDEELEGRLVIDTDGGEEEVAETAVTNQPEFQERYPSPDLFADEERRYSRDGTPLVHFPRDDSTQPPETSPEKLNPIAAIEKSITAALMTQKSVKSKEFVEETSSEGEEREGMGGGTVKEEVSPRALRRTAEIARKKTKNQIQSQQSSDSSDDGGSSSSDVAHVDLDASEDDDDDQHAVEDEDMSTFVPRVPPGLVTPQMEIMRFLAHGGDVKPNLSSSPARSVTPMAPQPALDWRPKVKENFTYDGEEPPVTSSILRALEKLKLMKCPFCERRIKKSSMSSAQNSDEECVLAHLMLAHAEEELAKTILCRKWYSLSHSKDDPSVIPSIFLLNPEKKTLVCSMCCVYQCDKLYSLRVHFTSCVQRTLAPPTVKRASTRRREPGKSHGCPLECGIRWKISKLYSPEVSQITHLIANHFGEKAAYEKGKELDKEHLLGAQFPYLDVAESWARSGDGMTLVCAKCGQEVARLAELVQHAEKKHDRLTCPFGCYLRKIGEDTNALEAAIHVLTHLPDPQALQFLTADAVAEKSASFPFDLTLSIKNILAEKDAPVTCKICEKRFKVENFRPHLTRSNCFDNVSRKTVIKINSKKAVQVKEEIPTPRRDTGHRKAKEHGVNCPICHRWFSGNPRYSPQISLLVHVLTRHQNEYGENFMAKLKSEDIRHQPPHIELRSSLEATKKLVGENFALVCAFCEARFSTMPKLLDHLDSHAEILRYAALKEPCEGCNKEIPSYCIGEDSFYRLVHALEHHVTDGDIDASILPDKTLPPFLDGEASINQSVDNATARFCCSQCPFIAVSSLSFLHHYMEHHCTNRTQKSLNYTCPVCKKSCPTSSSYGVRVSLLAHFIRCHPASKEVFVDSIGTEWSPKEYPFLDAEKSLETRKFVCSICDKDFATMCSIMRHVDVVHIFYQKSADTVVTSRGKRRPSGMREMETTPRKRPRLEAMEEGDGNIEDSVDERSTIFDESGISEGEESAVCMPVRPISAVGKNPVPIYRQKVLPSPSQLTIDDIDPDDPYALEVHTPLSSLVSSPKSTPLTTTPSIAAKRRSRCQQMFSSSQSSISNWLSPAGGGSNLTPQSVAVVMGGSSTTASEMNLEDILNEGLTGTPSSSKKAKDSSSIFSVLPQTHVADVFSHKAPVDVSHIEKIGGFKCSLCHFVGLTKRDINTHLRRDHADEMSGNKKNLDKARSVLSACCVCPKVFDNRKKLMVHIQEAHKDHPCPYPCSHCSKCFSTQFRLREHERRLHEQALKVAPSALICKYCEAVFGNPRNLQDHEKRHESGKQAV